MIGQADILNMARRLMAAAPPGSRVMLFGSRAKGTARADSDVDFLVIEPEVRDQIDEMARLRKSLRGSPVPIDILVTTPAHYEKWCETPTSVFYDIAREGKLIAELG